MAATNNSLDNLPLQVSWSWWSYFSTTTLQMGKADDEKGIVEKFQVEQDGSVASCTIRGVHCAAIVPTSYLECRDYEPWLIGFKRDWEESDYYSWGREIRRYDSRFQCSCSLGQKKNPCRHLAALLYHMERVRGKFLFTRSDEDVRILKERAIEEEERRRAEEEEERRRREEEKERLRKQKEKENKQKKVSPAIQFYENRMPEVPGDVHFDPVAILSDVQTDRYELDTVKELRRDAKNAKKSENATDSTTPTDAADPEAPANTASGKAVKASPSIRTEMSVSYDEKGEQLLSLQGKCDKENVTLAMTAKAFQQIQCSCGRARLKTSSYYSYDSRPTLLCAHALLVFEAAWRRIVSEKPGDETDKKADTFLTMLADGTVSFEEETAQSGKDTKKAEITLTPKITEDKRNGKLQLSFLLGREGERQYALRNLQKLVYAVEDSQVFPLTKKVEIDFSAYTFTEKATRWFQFILSRVRQMSVINARIEQKTASRYYYGGDATLSVGSAIPLEGSDLDLIYDMAIGNQLLCDYGSDEATYVKVGPGRVKASVQLVPARGKKDVLIGIDMTGNIPRLLQGNQYRYILDREQFGRVSERELALLTPYRQIADKDGNFQCRIGLKKFPEFYYRVLPLLRESKDVLLKDETADLKLDFLPPEGEYVFYIDYAPEGLSCRPEVRYGNMVYPLGFTRSSASAFRDLDQEKRVTAAVRALFPKENSKEHRFEAVASDEQLVRLLQNGVSLLEKYGEVRGSESFRKVRYRPAPQPRFSVQIDGGILELSVRTKDMTAEELLALLESYQQKKRWVRLKSGDFVDLEDADGLRELEEFAEKMDLSLKDLVKKGVSIPKYRALYVDKLLEGHDEIATSRDKYFKSLVRSFRTIQDSDFEVDENLTDTVRPYQLYGFRWLSTLSAAGFGGILADEMGLGKTLQMLAYLLSQKSSGETRPALVVCPASLVYNWKEEASRFAPGLSVELLAGGIASRREIFRQMAAGAFADLYVTSYDLLKRDITNYENILFSCICLDEAQYIKNQKTAMAKAVKVLKAEHRFAMTGTPIENRLAELWSIFDFLMPGFLYSASDFAARFEAPIMKNKDAEAIERLTKMTAPFILRRKKGDVLKDLPEKLEEVQSCQMEPDQRKLYDAQVVHMRKMLENFAGSGEEKLRVLAEITRLRQICCDPSLLFEDYKGSSAKREGCLDLVERAIDGGHRMLLFSQFTSMLDLLAEDLAERKIPYYMLTGSTPKQERIRLVNAFNEGDVPVFLISLKAGGTGLNLVGADVVIHYDPWWNVAVQNQATDRAHRIGQTRQVTVMKMVAVDTIEEKIIALQEAKREMADAIISGEGTSLASLSREELLALLG